MAIAVIWKWIGSGDRVVGRGSVVGVEVIAHEVPAHSHAAAGSETTAQVRMVVVDTCVHDGDLHAFAGETKLALRDVRASLLDGRHQFDARLSRGLVRRELQDRIDGLHAREAAQLAEIVRIDLDRYAIPQLAVGIAFTVVELLRCGSSPERRMIGAQRPIARSFRRRFACELH